MATTIRKIEADVARENTYDAILAKQYDQESRFLKIDITNRGEKIHIPMTDIAVINARRADGQAKAFFATVNEDGTVTAKLTDWMLEVDDVVNCSISIISNNIVKLTTMTFRVNVQYAEYGGDDITEDEDYDVLVTLIASIDDVRRGAETAAERAETSAAAAQRAAEEMVYVSFTMDDDGHLVMKNSDLAGTTVFAINSDGHMEVTL